MTLGLDVKAAASPALIKRGCVNAIGLAHIRVQAGSRWEKTCTAVYARLEGLLSHKLGPTDFFVRLSDSTYLVTMPSSDPADSRLCCLKIAYELQKSLLGHCSFDSLQLSRVTGESEDALELVAFSRDDLVDLAVRGSIEELYNHIPHVASAPRPVASVSDGPRFQFTPVWDAVHQAITSYVLDIRRPHTIGRTMPGLTREEFRQELNDLLAGLSYAASMLLAGLSAGNRYLTVFPISYQMLSTPTARMDILSACHRLAAELRPFLIFTISDVPVGVPQSRLADLIGSVRPFCRAVTVELPPSTVDNPSYQNLGHSCLSMTLPPTAMDRTAGEIKKVCESAKRLGLAAFIGGVQSLDRAEFARRAGATYLSGPFIGSSLDEPLPMRRLAWSDLAAARQLAAGAVRRPLSGTS